jgi:hypothetical protein
MDSKEVDLIETERNSGYQRLWKTGRMNDRERFFVTIQ